MNKEKLKASNLKQAWEALIRNHFQALEGQDTVSRETSIRDIPLLALNVGLDKHLWSTLELFAEKIFLANQRINLVSRKSPAVQILNNILDGVLLGVLVHAVSRETGSKILLIDGGSGSGIPGIPAKMVLDRLQTETGLVLVDSKRKKQDFLEAVIVDLQLSDTSVFRERLENPQLRLLCEDHGSDSSWILCTKALASTKQTLRWAHSLEDRLQAAFLIKGPLSFQEIQDNILKKMGWTLKATHRCRMPERENYILELVRCESQ